MQAAAIKERAIRERQCVATGETLPTEMMIRFVIGPDERLVPDIAGDLPGRGAWIRADVGALRKAIKSKAFSRRLAKGERPAPSAPDAGLESVIEAALAKSCLNLLGLARRAGQLVQGYEKVEALVRSGRAALLIGARDGSEDGRRRLCALSGGLPVVELFDRRELSLALGRENVVHAALTLGGLADRFRSEAARLSGFRSLAGRTSINE